ncbi:MAG: 30S ribosomal protein S17e [Candidatus Bathyarchaeota archaeon]|nr:30S ribosomal protein S17e [Candidatus Bathyarchaeota archaeon]
MKVAPTLTKRPEKTTQISEEINLGKVKTEQIKHLGKELMARFPNKFTNNFDENKRLVDALTKGTTTRVRNQVAGYITRTISLAQASNASATELEEPPEIAE